MVAGITPRPWKWTLEEHASSYGMTFFIREGDRTLCRIDASQLDRQGWSIAEGRERARAIAALPRLVAALYGCLAALEEEYANNDGGCMFCGGRMAKHAEGCAIDFARAALRQARGTRGEG